MLLEIASTISGMILSSPLAETLISRRQFVLASTLARVPGSLDTPSSLLETSKFTPVTLGFSERPSRRALQEGMRCGSRPARQNTSYKDSETYDMISPLSLQLERLSE